jgi:tetratricopeptide (TPR) repeat protein
VKVKKHQQDDKIAALYYQAVDYFEKNKNKVYWVITGVIVVIAVIFIYFKSQNAKEIEASDALVKIQTIYFSGNYQQAMNGDSLGIAKGLIYIVDNYGSTQSGQIAKILLANCYYSSNDFDNALKYYKDFSGKNEIMKAASLSGIASVNEAKGDFKEAAVNYEKASRVSKDIVNNDEYLYNAIRNYFNLKDTESVKKISKQIKENYPKSKFIAQLNRYDLTN